MKELCDRSGHRFEVADVRWGGVSEEAAMDQRTTAICFEEIARCQRVTPGPNFIFLLGDRLGWQPLPAAIPEREFEAILTKVSAADDKALLKAWYRLDENAAPPEYGLLPRWHQIPGRANDEAAQWAANDEAAQWAATESRLRAIFHAAIDALGWKKDDPRRDRFVASHTEQEIVRGVFEQPGAGEHVLGFFRTILTEDGRPLAENPPMSGSARTFLDVTQEDDGWSTDWAAHDRLVALKNRLRPLLGRNIFEYTATWTGPSITLDHIGTLPYSLDDCLELLHKPDLPHTLCNDVWRSLAGMILPQLQQLAFQDPVQAEVSAQDEFGKARRQSWVEGEAPLAAIADYLAAAEPHPLTVIGDPGSGKSETMARSVEQTQDAYPRAVTVVRFIGATSRSSAGRTLLDSMCRQISRAYAADESTVPAEYAGLAADFGKRLQLATAEKPLIIFLDALDRLHASDPARSLSWLPPRLPDHVRLIVSMLSDDFRKAPDAFKADVRRVTVGREGLPRAEEMLDRWLAAAGRTLQFGQRNEILRKFELVGTPLYLKLAFEEARLWRSFSAPQETVLGEGVSGLIEGNLFPRLADPGNHGEMLVSHALGYLAASRRGLSENEIMDVLSADDAVKADLRLRSPSTPQFDRLPDVAWSRLYFDLQPYLSEVLVEGTPLLTFYHNQLREAAVGQFAAGDAGRSRHTSLAGYFRDMADPASDRTWTGGSPRGLGELPYHLGLGGKLGDLGATLTDVDFLEQKAELPSGIYQIQDDFELALGLLSVELAIGSPATKGAYRILLDNIDTAGRAMRRDADLLERAPDVVWQQLGGGRVLVLEEANRPGPAPMHAFRRPSRRPDLAAATNQSPADRLTVAQSIERAIKREAHVLSERPRLVWQQVYNRVQWELDPAAPAALDRELANRSIPGHAPWLLGQVPMRESRALIQTLSGHSLPVTACAIGPDGATILTASADGTLKLWDAISGRARITLTGHEGTVTDCAFSPDGNSILSASRAGGLTIWDATTGRVLTTMWGHTRAVTGCAFGPDGAFVVSAGQDRTARIWDAATGIERAKLLGHTSRLTGCAVSPDGTLIVTASRDRTLRIWDAKTGANIATLAGHGDSVSDCAISPDGGMVISASHDGTLKAWDLASSAECGAFIGHAGAVTGCAISPDGAWVVSASNDRTVRVWDLKTSAAVATLYGHTRAVLGCAVGPDGLLIASVSCDGTLKTWAMDADAAAVAPSGHADAVWDCAVSPDGAYVVSAGGDDTLKVWDGDSLDFTANLVGHTREVDACAVSPDGVFVVSASEDGTLRMWDPGTGTERFNTVRHSGAVKDCAVGPDGASIVSTQADRLEVWDSTRAEPLTTGSHAAEVLRCAVSPDASFIVSASKDKTLKVWDASNGFERLTLEGHTADVSSCAVSPDASFIVSASKDKTLKVWDSSSGAERLTLSGHTAAVSGCGVSPDGAFIVSAGEDWTLRVWDARLGTELAIVPTLGPLLCVALYPSIPRAVCGDFAGSLSVFDIVGIEYGPIIVTAHEFGGNLSVVCPACRRQIALDRGQLGRMVLCPSHDCESRLQLNAFTLRPVSQYLDQDDFVLALAKIGSWMGYGCKPLTVTPVDFGEGLVVGCRWCTRQSPLKQEWRGMEILCPECKRPLKVDSFVPTVAE